MSEQGYRVCVTLLLETTDPRLSESAIAEATESGNPASILRIRRAIRRHLPHNIRRILAVLPADDR